jgi:hypothetical protein
VDVGDVAERIHGIEGCHLASPDPTDLATKLRLIRQSRQRLDCRACLAELSITRVAEKLKECYQDIAANPSFVSMDRPVMPAISSAN